MEFFKFNFGLSIVSLQKYNLKKTDLRETERNRQ